MTANDEQAFLDKVRQRLDAAAEQLDGADVTRLRSARRAALAGLEARAAAPRAAWLWPLAGALSAALVVAVAGALWWSTPRAPLPGYGLEDVELIAVLDQADLYNEVEFYRWLAEQANAG